MPIRFYVLSIAALFSSMLGAVGSVRAQMEHVLFITDDLFTINSAAEPNPIGNTFGGQLSADFLCTQRASWAGLLLNWDGQTRPVKALISSATENANARKQIFGRVVNTHGELLANNQADLWDGTIVTGVKYNEHNQLLSHNTIFWTGSDSFGVVSQTAQNWTTNSSSQVANIGLSHATINWFNQLQLSANPPRRLPCLCEATVINPGDFNDNGQVDAADYVVWRKSVGSVVARGFEADGDGDGTIDSGDYSVWRAKLDTNYSAGRDSLTAGTSVPEPSSVFLLGFVAISLLGGGRHKSQV